MATNFGVSTSSPFRRDPVVLPGGIAETHSIPFCRLLRAWCLWCSFREKICYIITLDKRRGRKTWRRKPFLHVISPETELPENTPVSWKPALWITGATAWKKLLSVNALDVYVFLTEISVVLNRWTEYCTTSSWTPTQSSSKTTRLETACRPTSPTRSKELSIVWREESRQGLIMYQLSCSSRAGKKLQRSWLSCIKESENARNGPNGCSQQS